MTPEAWKLGSLMNAAPRLRELRLNGVLRRLTEVAKQCQPEAAAAAAVEEEELPPVERIESREALAARIVELSEGARWVALHVGAEFSLATDAARLTMAMGGDLLSPGISDAEAWEDIVARGFGGESDEL